MITELSLLNSGQKAELLAYLSEFMTENRKNLLRSVVNERTRHFTVVLEDIFQPHNASAVLRTCECLGIQDVHIIENRYPYNINPDVTLGSDKWLDIRKYMHNECSTKQLIDQLRGKGYTIAATCLHKDSIEPSQLPLHRPVALLFGTELEGLSNEAITSADIKLRIPIYGFTESYNISVSAAILLSYLTRKSRETGVLWELSENEKTEILLQWTMKSVRSSGLLVKKFLSSYET